MKLWKDTGCSDIALSISFPSLFAIATSKDACVCKELGEEVHWSLCFSGQFNDWELGSVEAFLSKLQKYLDNKDMKDKSVSLPLFLGARKRRNSSGKWVWNPWVSTKIGFFTCEAIWGRIFFTLNQLKRRWWTLVNRSNLCKIEEESADHVFHCAKMRILWHLLFLLFKVEWMVPQSERLYQVGKGPLWGRSIVRYERARFMPTIWKEKKLEYLITHKKWIKFSKLATNTLPNRDKWCLVLNRLQ